MRKILFSLGLFSLLFSVSKANAQYSEGDTFINAGIGLASYYGGSGFKMTIPPVEAGAEFMVSDDFSVGGFFGINGFKYEQPSFDFDDDWGSSSATYKFTYINVGAVGNYHFVNSDQWNVYGGARLGYVSLSAKYEAAGFSGDADDNVVDALGARASGILFGVQAGARYHFSEKLAANAELGWGVAAIKVGITYKL